MATVNFRDFDGTMKRAEVVRQVHGLVILQYPAPSADLMRRAMTRTVLTMPQFAMRCAPAV